MSDSKSYPVRLDSKGRVKWGRCPTLPGQMLKSLWLTELGISLEDFSNKSGIRFRDLDDLVNKEGDMTFKLAEQLGNYLGTTPQLWMNLQKSVNDFRDQQREKLEEESKSTPSEKKED